jgi:hypothetical protein
VCGSFVAIAGAIRRRLRGISIDGRKCRFNGWLGDFVEDDAPCLLLGDPGGLTDVPCDRFALAVGVCREVDTLRVPGGIGDLVDDCLLIDARRLSFTTTYLGWKFSKSSTP